MSPDQVSCMAVQHTAVHTRGAAGSIVQLAVSHRWIPLFMFLATTTMLGAAVLGLMVGHAARNDCNVFLDVEAASSQLNGYDTLLEDYCRRPYGRYRRSK